MELIHGDCIEEMAKLPDSSIDCIICDLPYGITRCVWDVPIPLGPMWEQINRIRKERCPVLLFGVEPFSSMVRASNLGMFKYDLIWEKTEATGHLNANKRPMVAHEKISVYDSYDELFPQEEISIFYEKQCYYMPVKTHGHCRKTSRTPKKINNIYGKERKIPYDSTSRYPRSVLKFSTDKQKSKLHPTQKPVALLKNLIETYSKKGDLLLDFAAGSGSLGEAALLSGRHVILIEKDIDIWNTAAKRLAVDRLIHAK